MLDLIHAPAAYGFCGQDITVQALVPDNGQEVVELLLCYTCNEKEYSKRMLPTDGFTADESYSLYSATVCGAHLTGERFSYRFLQKGIGTGSYEVPLLALPQLPPFLFTEFAPELRDEITYLEICNPGAAAVDLYDYELLLQARGKILGRNPLAHAPHTHVLAAGEAALLRFYTAKLFALYGSEEGIDAAFWSVLANLFPANCEEIAAHPPKCFTVVTAQKTAQGYEDLPQSFCIYQTYAYRLLVVPRGGGADDVLHALDVCTDELCLDVPVSTTAVYGADLRAPQQALRLATKRQGTPATPDVGQVFPNSTDAAVPAILPLQASERILLGAGDLCLRFAVLGGAAGCPTVWVKQGEEYRAYAATMTNEGVWEVVIPALTLATLGDKLCYYIEVTGGCYTARLGSAAQPYTRRIRDNAGPMILSQRPAEGQAIEPADAAPLVSFRFLDGAGVNLRTSVLCFDGLNVSADAVWSECEVTYTPKKLPDPGEHVVEITLRDTLGNRTYRRVPFVISDGEELQFFHGEVHSHTVDSDARGAIEQAMEHARDVGKVDFFAVTDHCVYLEPQDILRHKRVADRFNQNGRFATLYGYEVSWGKRGFWGHMNVLGGEQLFYAPHTAMSQLFEKLEQDDRVIAQFNHPGDEWGDFDGFAGYNSQIDKRLCLQEVKRMSFDDCYALSLARGWHVSPTYNEDNHGADWTTRTKGTTVVLAHSLTRENIMDAMRKNRTYATLDDSMRISFRVNGKWLGARLRNPSKLTVEIKVATDRAEGIGTLMLMAEDNIAVATMEAGARKSVCWELELAPDFDYYYLRIVNGSVYSVTAPVFVECDEALTLCALQQGNSGKIELPLAVSAVLQNKAQTALNDVSVSFYQTAQGGFDLERQVPIETVYVGRLEPGETHTVCRAFANLPQKNRISAVLCGQLGKRRVADSGFVMASPVIVSRICPLTSPDKGEENPYPYIELYNQTSAPVTLDGYQLRARHEQGRHRPHSLEYLSLDGITLPPDGTLVIWCKAPKSALTVADFNEKYGTSLVEGKDLILTDRPLILTDEAGHPTDLCYGDVTVSRAYYGSFCRFEDLVADSPYFFAASQDMTPCEQRLYPAQILTPGELVPGQRLPLMNAASRSCEQLEEQRAKERDRVVNKLTKRPLVPVQAAAFVANAFTSLRHLFREKE